MSENLTVRAPHGSAKVLKSVAVAPGSVGVGTVSGCAVMLHCLGRGWYEEGLVEVLPENLGLFHLIVKVLYGVCLVERHGLNCSRVLGTSTETLEGYQTDVESDFMAQNLGLIVCVCRFSYLSI